MMTLQRHSQVVVYLGLAAALVLMFAHGAVAQQGASSRSAGGSDEPARWLMINMSTHEHSRMGRKMFRVVKTLSGNPHGKIIHFTKLSPELLAESDPEFIVLGPQSTPWCRYKGARGIALQNFLWLLPVVAEEMNIPILGVCGGHQALAMAFGGRVGPIRGGEEDCLPYNRARQSGVIPITRTAPDPLFRGMENKLRIRQNHYDEVKALPPGFLLLGSQKMSPIQIMRHPTRPVYGIQGHVEYFRRNCPDGGTIIRNFLDIARNHNRTSREAVSRGQSSGVMLSSVESQNN
ncbi:type 1 glutamine amidotransferase [Thermodesulfobacteriota bacterium]